MEVYDGALQNKSSRELEGQSSVRFIGAVQTKGEKETMERGRRHDGGMWKKGRRAERSAKRRKEWEEMSYKLGPEHISMLQALTRGLAFSHRR